MAISACRTVHNMACWLPSYQLDAEANINLLQSAVDNALKMPDDAKTDAVHSIKPNAEEMGKWRFSRQVFNDLTDVSFSKKGARGGTTAPNR